MLFELVASSAVVVPETLLAEVALLVTLVPSKFNALLALTSILVASMAMDDEDKVILLEPTLSSIESSASIEIDLAFSLNALVTLSE